VSTFPAWQWSLLAVPQFLAALTTLGAALLVGPQRRRSVEAWWIWFMLLAMTWWSATSALQIHVADLEVTMRLSQLSYLGIVACPVALLHFVFAYTRDGARAPGRVVLPLYVAAAFILGAVLTNDAHRLYWAEVSMVPRGELLYALYERGPLFWVTIAYCYGTMASASLLLARHTHRLGGVFRRQSLLILLATLAPWVTSIAYVLRLGPAPEVDQTPVGFALTGVALSWAVVRNRLFDLVPVSATTLFDRLPDPVLVTDGAWRLVRANDAACRRFGLTAGRLGEPLATALASEPALAAELLGHAEPRWQSTVKAGETWWSIDSGVLSVRSNLAAGRLILLDDVTEQKRAELLLAEALAHTDRLRAEAVAANTAKSSFLAQVSHDLRTPLHAIMGFSGLALSRELDPRLRAEVTSIRDAGAILQRLINDLLDLSRIEAGKLDLADKSFLIDDALDPVADLLSVTARGKGIRLVHRIEPGAGPMLRGDPDRLRQVLFNLAGNAVKFTREGGVLVVARPEGRPGWICIEIEDTGPGIPADRLAGLFQPFNRGDAEAVRQVEGTGLGLAISRRIVDAMGGTIEVESEPGRGTVFRVRLPAGEPGAPPPEWTALSGPLAGREVAVVLRDAGRREAAAAALRGFGARPVVCAAPGEVPPGVSVLVDAGAPVGTLAGRHVVRIEESGEAGAVLLNRRSLGAALLAASPSVTASPFVRLSRPLHVLVADDNAINRRVGSAMLERIGCTVSAADGGVEALAKMGAERFDAVVLDGHMGDVDGWDVARRMRSGEAGAAVVHTPVLALTADLTPAAREKWRQAGASEVLGKPVRMDELAEALMRCTA
jgi:signal transduction histidine kinase/CheY-like chemotaxis protein